MVNGNFEKNPSLKSNFCFAFKDNQIIYLRKNLQKNEVIPE